MPRKKMSPQKRAERSRRMTEEFWAAKKTAARTPEERCKVAFDRLRAEFADMPPAARDQGWTALAGWLESAVNSLTSPGK